MCRSKTRYLCSCTNDLHKWKAICAAAHHSAAPAAHISGTVGSNIRKYTTAHPGSCRFLPPPPRPRPPGTPLRPPRVHSTRYSTPFTVSAQLQGLGDGLAATGIGPAPDTPVRPETSWPFPPWGSTDNDPDPVSRAQPSPPLPLSLCSLQFSFNTRALALSILDRPCRARSETWP